MSEISFFIAASAVAFSTGMYAWDLIKSKLSPRALLAVCYFLELVMVTSVIYAGPKISEQHSLAYLIAGCYGLYQCFFWTTQRALFIQRSSSTNTGDRYGNFQIFVVVALKIGVFIGAFLLENDNIQLLFIISLVSILLGFLLVINIPGQLDWPFMQWPSVSLAKVATFKDAYRSKAIFALDGFFLFIESFFWLLSLFLILKQSFMQLGMMIIAITVMLSVVFLVLKSKIDKMPEQLVYALSIAGYAISWILRGNLDAQLTLFWQFIYLCLIAFLTALFRLAFNKRFYDLAVHYPKTPYILMKSYYSQTTLILFFGLLGWVFMTQQTIESLNLGYWIAAALTPVYFIYRTRKKSEVGSRES
ncbi:MAG: hypothetical protein MJK10_00625 [Pseudomonadales bacterium]|nr:hypothetical protein [Pseudomonadales bacterium]